jgi:hypothetical protein
MLKVEKKRKIRSDKKVDVKPTIPLTLKESIHRLGYITDTPIKDIAEVLCIEGISSRKVIELLSIHFRRSYQYGNTVYMGDLTRTSLQKVKFHGPTDRITTRLKDGIAPDGTEETYSAIKALAYSLDVTPHKAAALLLEATIKDNQIISKIVRAKISGKLDQTRLQQLDELLKFINKNNPYKQTISLSMFLSALMDDIKSGVNSIGSSLYSFLDRVK